MTKSEGEIFFKFSSWAARILVFLAPLFFLPLTFEYFEFNKIQLIFFLTAAVVFFRLAGMFASGKLIIKRSRIDAPLVFFLSALGVSAVLSLDSRVSLLGAYGRWSDSFFFILSLVVFFFFIVNAVSFREGELKAKSLAKWFLVSWIIASVFSLLSFSGRIGSFWADYFYPYFNPVAGSAGGLAVFVAAGAVFAASLILSGRFFAGRPVFRKGIEIPLVFFFLVSLVLLAAVNFWPAWTVFAAGIVFAAIVALFIFKIDRTKVFYFSGGIVSVAALIFILKLLFFSAPAIPAEARVDIDNSFSIAGSVLAERPFFGAGPGSYSYQFSFYRPVAMNNSILWPVRFDRSFSYLLELSSSAGLVSLCSYLLLAALFFYFSFSGLKKQKRDGLFFSLIAGAFASLAAQAVYPGNAVLLFTFYFFLGLGAARLRHCEKTKIGSLVIRKEKRTVFTAAGFFVFVIFAGAVAVGAYVLRFWLADYFYHSDEASENNLKRASELNPGEVRYQIDLSRIYFRQFLAEAIKPESDRNQSAAAEWLEKSVKTARSAAEKNPLSVAVWENLGIIYRDLPAKEAQLAAVSFFEKAGALEPTNPVLAAETGKVLLKSGLADRATENFRRALELKPDYLEAAFFLARSCVARGLADEAYAILDALEKEVEDPEIFYEEGKILYNQGKVDQAIERFKLALKIASNHINSLYALGIAYESKGLSPEAADYYRRAFEFDPSNEELKAKVKKFGF